MYPLRPKAVYVHKRVYDNAQAVERMQRMLDAMGIAERDVPHVDLSDILAFEPEYGASEKLAKCFAEHDTYLLLYTHYLDEVRRLSPRTPFALCTEHPELWERLAPKLAMRPDAMFCCCGGLSSPRP